MPKPNVYIINNGGIGTAEPSSNLGEGAFSNQTTVGLIEYEKEGSLKYMLVDTGMAAACDTTLKGIEEHGKREDVTHLLVTHWDQDHMQNIKEFPGALVVSGISTARVGTDDFGMVNALYPNGYIENEAIRFKNVNRTHSRDEMIYIVDSENQGKVAFIGDLLFAPLKELPTEQAVMFDKMATIDIGQKYFVLKDLLEKNSDVQKFFVGHSPSVLNRDDVAACIKAMETPVYKDAIKELVQQLESKAEKYKKLL